MAPPVQYNSRTNTVLRDYWATATSITLGLATTTLGFADPVLSHLPDAAPFLNVIVPALLGTTVGNGVNALFNRWGARVTSTVDQAYQEAIIWPHPENTPGYLVLQPRHRKTLRHFLSDTLRLQRPPRVLGWASTLDQAQALCRRVTGDEGQPIDLQAATPAWQKMLALGYKKYRKHSPAYWEDQTVQQLTGIWRLTSWPSDTPSPAMGAYRTVHTAYGPQIEFYPSPPQSLPSSEAVYKGLKQQALLSRNDDMLPQRLPPGSPLSQAPELQTAWTVQHLRAQATIPWTLLNVAPPDRIPSWTAGCATPNAAGDGVTWHFYPTPPRTLSDPQQLMHDLRRYSAPHQTPDEWPVAVTPPQDALAQWQALARPRSAVAPAAPTLALRSRSRSL